MDDLKRQVEELVLELTLTRMQHFAHIEAVETAFLDFVEATSGQQQAHRAYSVLQSTYKKSLNDSLQKIEQSVLKSDVLERIKSELKS